MYLIRIIRADGTKGYVVRGGTKGLQIVYRADNAFAFDSWDAACDFLDDHPELLSPRHQVKVVRGEK